MEERVKWVRGILQDIAKKYQVTWSDSLKYANACCFPDYSKLELSDANPDFLYNWLQFSSSLYTPTIMEFSFSTFTFSFPWKFLANDLYQFSGKYLSFTEKRMYDNYLRIIKPLGYSAENIAYINLEQSMTEPYQAYFIVFKHAHRITVMIRGSYTNADNITNFDAMPVELKIGEISGYVHKGFLQMAQKVLRVLREKQLLESYYKGEADLIFCGHSMGAAVATICVALLSCEHAAERQFTLEQDNSTFEAMCPHQRLFGFGASPPACVSRSIAEYLKPYVTCALMWADNVCRMSEWCMRVTVGRMGLLKKTGERVADLRQNGAWDKVALQEKTDKDLVVGGKIVIAYKGQLLQGTPDSMEMFLMSLVGMSDHMPVEYFRQFCQ